MGMYSMDAASAFEKLRAEERFSQVNDETLRGLLLRIVKANDSYNDTLNEDDYYDDDEAYDRLCRAAAEGGTDLDTAEELVDAYMEINDEYLEALGLIEWE